MSAELRLCASTKWSLRVRLHQRRIVLERRGLLWLRGLHLRWERMQRGTALHPHRDLLLTPLFVLVMPRVACALLPRR